MSADTVSASGSSLAAYERQSVIGSGSFGKVYRIRRKSDGRVSPGNALKWRFYTPNVSLGGCVPISSPPFDTLTASDFCHFCTIDTAVTWRFRKYV